ncbi:MAG: hypothetical protein ABEK29_06210, partial [Bradymonadaceae bacterium]
MELPGQPEVLDIKLKQGEMGSEDALRVWVVVPDDTPDEQLTWPDVRALEEALKERFRAVQDRYYPV